MFKKQPNLGVQLDRKQGESSPKLRAQLCPTKTGLNAYSSSESSFAIQKVSGPLKLASNIGFILRLEIFILLTTPAGFMPSLNVMCAQEISFYFPESFSCVKVSVVEGFLFLNVF